MRINRYLSQCGVGSRRGCEQIITEGRVYINNKLVTDLATQVGPDDKVSVDGKSVKAEAGIVIALHKPRGFICTRNDTHSRTTIYDLLPANLQTLHHVGRLDKESEGLILLTNRGDLSHRLIHPSQGAEKEYEVVTDQPMDHEVMSKLVKGMFTEEGFAKAERAWLVSDRKANLVLKQGLKRQIRLMMYQLGFEVERLVRTRIGWLELRGLPKGTWRELSAAEVERFFSKEGGVRPGKSPAKDRPTASKPRGERMDDEDSYAAPAKKRAPSARSGGGLTRRTPQPGRRSEGPSAKSRPFRGGSNSSREEDYTAPERPFRSSGAGRGRPSGRGPARSNRDEERPASPSDRPSRGKSARSGLPRGRPGGSASSFGDRSGAGGSRRPPTKGPRRGPPKR